MTCKHHLITIAAAFLVCGCSAGPQEVAKDEIQKATLTAQSTRALFDSVGGDFEKLSASDKKKLAETYKSEDGAKKVFESIKHPPVGGGGSMMPPQATGK